MSHPPNRRLFGCRILVTVKAPNSARTDILTDDVLPQHELVEGRRYFDGTHPEFADVDNAFKFAGQAMEGK